MARNGIELENRAPCYVSSWQRGTGSESFHIVLSIQHTLAFPIPCRVRFRTHEPSLYRDPIGSILDAHLLLTSFEQNQPKYWIRHDKIWRLNELTTERSEAGPSLSRNIIENAESTGQSSKIVHYSQLLSYYGRATYRIVSGGVREKFLLRVSQSWSIQWCSLRSHSVVSAHNVISNITSNVDLRDRKQHPPPFRQVLAGHQTTSRSRFSWTYALRSAAGHCCLPRPATRLR